ncbi:uncharacterized protein V6R79_009323 [Siganus canaliculatus]
MNGDCGEAEGDEVLLSSPVTHKRRCPPKRRLLSDKQPISQANGRSRPSGPHQQ